MTSLPTYNPPVVHEKFNDLTELRAFAKRLIHAWDRDRDRTFKMKREYADATGPVIWSYTQHVVELMRTVLDLSEQDRIVIAIPLIRLAVENTMTSIWMYLYPGAARAIIHEGLRTRRAGIKDILEVGAAGFDEAKLAEVEAQLEEFSDHALPAGRYFDKRCREIVDGLGVYATWRVYSGLSHAGLTLADFYLREIPQTDTDPMGIAFDPDAKLSAHEAFLGSAVCMLIASLKICDQIDGEGRRKTQVERAAKKMGITLDFKLASAQEAPEA